ncbi:hypothetical protein FISHEDRAFT_34178 [Fistulina hepatica ATCC 64428]|uniref:Uncharacterized protein n=1 Tax=Fistulina hepatica ATCC 64428 TaxID=1128425 RepID=A0A0D7AMN9_9AGAR|nr:hypothetical protein FISHEDRAFT_34178 [Fistulina hepatica ATCC 64428]
MIELGALQLFDDSERILDPDEEATYSYDGQQMRHDTPFRGLGYLDSRHDHVLVRFEFKDANAADLTAQEKTRMNNPVTSSASRPGHGRRSKHPSHAKRNASDVKYLEITLAQDSTSLHSRKGDTGSVLWRASADFAQLILQQFHEQSTTSCFRISEASSLQVLELGSGIGLLPIVLGPLVQRFIATDIQHLLPLIRKNLTLNSSRTANVLVEELDWERIHAVPASLRHRFSLPFDPPPDSESTALVQADACYPDIIISVDCIYHPRLVPPLVSTLTHFTEPGHTVVVIVCELRAEDVLREFLQQWLASDDAWEVWRAGDGNGEGLLGNPYVVWVGRRVVTSTQ